MLVVLAAALSVMARAQTAEYAAIRDPTIVCSDPHRLAVITYLHDRGYGSEMANSSMRAGKCWTVFPEQRICVDFLEDIRWKVDEPGEKMSGTAKMFRGRRPQADGVDDYFYGLAAQFTYVGAMEPAPKP